MQSGYLKKVKPEYQPLLIILFDTLSVYSPLGVGWLHEEWHRSVLTQNQISSYNGIYDYDLFNSAIPIKEVADQDLINLKADSPADMVRLHSAGLEAEYEMNLVIEKHSFFFDHNPAMQFILLLNHLNNFAYMGTCATSYGDRTTHGFLSNETTDISDRDFTGLDCVAWVYDLFRPDEPYSARGTHPSGVGIDRYRTLDDLTTEEKHFLRLQTGLSLLNLIDPFLFHYSRFTAGDWQWNLNLRHHLTPFGYNLGSNLFLKKNTFNLLVTANMYVNNESMRPGFDVSVYRFPMTIFDYTLHASLRFIAWLQPQALLFADNKWKPGALTSLQLNFPTRWKSVEGFFAAEYKTDGWVAGNTYLDRAFGIRSGFTLVFQKQSPVLEWHLFDVLYLLTHLLN
jgi:hypothetical protein